MSRRQLLVGGVGATAALLAGADGATAIAALPAPTPAGDTPAGATAIAALPAPTPAGDDVGFLAFGVVAEGVLAAAFGAALAVRGAWSPAERRELSKLRAGHRANVARLNAALGPDDTVTAGDFSRQVRVGTRKGALKVGRELEALAGGAYLGGLAAAGDYGTRLLLGRLLALTSSNGAVLTRMAGRPPGGLPAPVDLDAAGLRLDTYLRDPTS